MATPEDSAGARLEPPAAIDDVESGSSYAGSASSAPATPSCPYRDSQFHDQECLRYFDCPTHILRRDGADAASPEDPGGGTEATPTTTWQPEVAGIQTEPPDGEPSPAGEEESATASSNQSSDQSSADEAASSPSSPRRPSSQRATGIGAMTLMEALHDTRAPSGTADPGRFEAPEAADLHDRPGAGAPAVRRAGHMTGWPAGGTPARPVDGAEPYSGSRLGRDANRCWFLGASGGTRDARPKPPAIRFRCI